MVKHSSNWSTGSSTVAPRASPMRASCTRRSSVVAPSGPFSFSCQSRQPSGLPTCCASALASASIGAFSGRMSGRITHWARRRAEQRQHARLQQRGLARARRPDDDHEARAALGAPRIEPLEHGAALLVASEIDRRVLLLERVDPRIGRPRRIERETARQLVRDRAQAVLQPLQPARVPVDQIDRLDVRENEAARRPARTAPAGSPCRARAPGSARRSTIWRRARRASAPAPRHGSASAPRRAASPSSRRCRARSPCRNRGTHARSRAGSAQP